jgi:bifunctional UDP-N-acetylglucosamine pyrophosphorylase/glucosamine-1-phosphate N-acetyltransferase
MESLAAHGITEQIVVVNSRDAQAARKVAQSLPKISAEIVESGSQEGMGAEILKVADGLSGPFVVASGHAVNAGDNYSRLEALGRCDAAICASHVPDVSEYGEAKLEGDSKVVAIEEKPKNPHPGYRIVGAYLLSPRFVSALREAKPGHYSFEGALSQLAVQGKVLCAKVEGYQPTLKYPWHLLLLKNFLMGRALAQKPVVEPGAEVHKSAIITGSVHVSEGARVMENAVITGPAYIGKGATVGTASLVRDHSCVEAGAVVGYCTEVKNALLGESASAHHCSVEDSVIDRNCRLAAFSVTANRRFDRQSIKSDSQNGKIDTGLGFLGAIMAEDCWLGVNASTMPGVKLGAGAGVMPNKVAYRDLKEGEKVE